MYSYFQKLIDQGFALVYIDNILLLAHIKIHMLDLIEQLHQISSSNILKISPEKSFCYLLTVKFLGLAIGNKTIKPISSKFDGIHKLETPTSRSELMRFIGSLKFYSNFMNKLHRSLEPFCTLLHYSISSEWIPEVDKLFMENEASLSEVAAMQFQLPLSFYINVDAFLSGLGAIVFQPNTDNEMQDMS